jgi:hypothetical protein
LMAAEAHRFRWAIPNDRNRMMPALRFHPRGDGVITSHASATRPTSTGRRRYV